MKKSQTGFAHVILIIGVIVVVAMAAAGFVILKKKNNKTADSTVSIPVSTKVIEPNGTPENAVIAAEEQLDAELTSEDDALSSEDEAAQLEDQTLVDLEGVVSEDNL